MGANALLNNAACIAGNVFESVVANIRRPSLNLPMNLTLVCLPPERTPARSPRGPKARSPTRTPPDRAHHLFGRFFRSYLQFRQVFELVINNASGRDVCQPHHVRKSRRCIFSSQPCAISPWATSRPPSASTGRFDGALESVYMTHHIFGWYSLIRAEP